MSIFRRRRDDDDAAGADAALGAQEAEGADGATEAPSDEAADGATTTTGGMAAERFSRTDGPWDVAERPEAEGLDFGSLILPPPPADTALELSLEFDPEGTSLVGLSLGTGESSLQLLAFAAPRSGGLWAEVRAELAESLRAQGGVVTEDTGPLGAEITATLPVALPDGTPALSLLRFLGVDGPRWFLRGVVSGAATQQPEAAAVLEEIFRGVVVRRGDGAMPPREALPLTLPEQLAATVESSQAEAQTDAPAGAGEPAGEPADTDTYTDTADEGTPRRFEDLNPFERGPEITEIR